MLKSSFGEIHRKHKYFHAFCPFKEDYTYTSSPNRSPIFQSYSFQVSGHQPSHWPQPVNWCIITHPDIFPSERSARPCALPEVLPTERISLCPVLQGRPREGLQGCSCPLSDGACISCRPICKPGWILLSFCQLVVENSPWGHRCGLGGEGSVAGVGTVGMRATSSRNFLVSWGPAQTPSPIHPFHLVMACCYAGPALWLGGSPSS